MALALPIISAHSLICLIYVCVVEIKTQLEGVSPLYPVGLGVQAQVTKLGGKSLYTLSHLDGLFCKFFRACVCACVYNFMHGGGGGVGGEVVIESRASFVQGKDSK